MGAAESFNYGISLTAASSPVVTIIVVLMSHGQFALQQGHIHALYLAGDVQIQLQWSKRT